MIEIEKKFSLTDREIKSLTHGANLLSSKTFTDTYYDDENRTLTRKDFWLRKRDDQYELKIPLHNGVEREADQYEEINNIEIILEKLKLQVAGSFEQTLEFYGFKPFCICKTTRQKYRKDEFIIDIDKVEYEGIEDFSYYICEIELSVENKDQIEQAIKQILKLAEEYNLSLNYIRGKVIEYLKRKKPKHYQALIEANVMKLN